VEVLNKTSGVLTLFLLLLALFAIVSYMVYFYIPSVRGSYTISITAEKPLESVVLELPITEDNRPIYRIKEITCFVKSNGYLREIKPVITSTIDGNPKSILLPITGTGTFNIVGEYVLEEEKLIDYSRYPWTLIVDSKKYEVPVYVERDIMLQVVYIMKENSMILVPSLGILTVLCGGLSVARLFRGLFFQEKVPTAPKKKCTKWYYVCVNFFKIEQGSQTGKQLPKPYIDKLMKLLLNVNETWKKCCIKFIPCIDSKGNIVAKYVNPDRDITYATAGGKIIIGRYKIDFKIVRKLKLKDLFKDPNSTRLEVSESKVNAPYKEKLEATWKKDIEYKGVKYKAGEKIPNEIVNEIVKKGLEVVNKRLGESGLPENEKQRLLKRKKLFEYVLKIIKEENIVKRGEIPVIGALKGIEKLKDDHLSKCINVFIVKEYEDKVEKGEEGGCGEFPGRITIIEEKVIEENISNMLAHEFGHNLGLDHVPPNPQKPNLMETPVKGNNLTKKQCKKAFENCMKDKRKHFSEKTCHEGLKYLRKLELFREIEKLKKENKEIDKQVKKLRKSKEEVDKQIEDLKEQIKSEEKMLKKEKALLKKVSSTAKRAERYKDIIRTKKGRRKRYAEKSLDRMESMLEKDIERLKGKLEKAIKRNREKEAKELEKKIGEKETLLEAVRDPEATLKKYSEKVKALEEEIGKLKEKLKEYESKAPELKNKIDNKIKELRNKLNNNKNRINKLEKEIKELG